MHGIHRQIHTSPSFIRRAGCHASFGLMGGASSNCTPLSKSMRCDPCGGFTVSGCVCHFETVSTRDIAGIFIGRITLFLVIVENYQLEENHGRPSGYTRTEVGVPECDALFPPFCYLFYDGAGVNGSKKLFSADFGKRWKNISFSVVFGKTVEFQKKICHFSEKTAEKIYVLPSTPAPSYLLNLTCSYTIAATIAVWDNLRDHQKKFWLWRQGKVSMNTSLIRRVVKMLAGVLFIEKCVT